MLPDRSQHMSRHGPQLAIAVNSHIKFEAKGPGGLRLSLMHNLTDFSYYINIVIMEDEIILGYAALISLTTSPRNRRHPPPPPPPPISLQVETSR